MRKNKEDNKKYNDAWYQANKERINRRDNLRYQSLTEEERHTRYQANKEYTKQRVKLHYESNKEECKKYAKEYYQENKEQVKLAGKIYRLRVRYGLSYDEYNALLEKTGGKCPICNVIFGKGNKRACVDHCHKTNKIRGIICSRCNKALGEFNDNSELITKAAEWLKKSA